jgi:hypothetical protein
MASLSVPAASPPGHSRSSCESSSHHRPHGDGDACDADRRDHHGQAKELLVALFGCDSKLRDRPLELEIPLVARIGGLGKAFDASKPCRSWSPG